MIRECKKNGARKTKRKIVARQGRKVGLSPAEMKLTEKEARREAERCLGLRECESCEICSLFCPEICITHNENTGAVEIDLDYCKGCGICAAVCPKGAIQMVLEEGE